MKVKTLIELIEKTQEDIKKDLMEFEIYFYEEKTKGAIIHPVNKIGFFEDEDQLYLGSKCPKCGEEE